MNDLADNLTYNSLPCPLGGQQWAAAHYAFD